MIMGNKALNESCMMSKYQNTNIYIFSIPSTTFVHDPFGISFKSCGLSKQFGQSEQEEIDISDTSELTSEGFYLRIE